MFFITKRKHDKIVNERLMEESLKTSRNYERDLLMKQANIATLQSQINPHFLYNTLECIRGQALYEGSKEIAATVQALSEFFRYSISGKSDLVSIKNEMENVEHYVTIQNYRFDNLFEMEFNCKGEDISEALLPKLSLQPAVENAIIHGFSDKTSGGKITLTAKRVNGHVSIEISDNGKGIDTDKLEALCDKLHDSKIISKDVQTISTGIGLENVDRRLKLIFGEEYGVSISSCLGVGTCVELFFPYWLSVKHNEQ